MPFNASAKHAWLNNTFVLCNYLIHLVAGSSHENIQHLMDDTSTCFGSIALSLFASNFAYAGWSVLH